MDEIGVGIVGCGNISTIYLTNLPHAPGVKVRACADMKPEVAEAQGKRFGVEAMTVDALLARDDIQFIVNLTVPAAHGSVSLAALTGGKHVFSEKPLAVDVELGRKVIEEAESRKLMIGCAPDTFLGAGGRLSRKLVDDGAVGRILSGGAFLMSHGMEHWHPDPEFFFKKGGGPVLDVGVYYITALVNLLGPVARVHAVTSTGFPERIVTSEGPRKGYHIQVETPTTCLALLEFASGALLTFAATWDVWKHGHPPIELYGTEGTLRVPDPNFYGGVVETSARSGDWITHDSGEDAARPSELAGRRTEPGELSRARRCRHDRRAKERPPLSRKRQAGAPRPRRDGGHRERRQRGARAGGAAGCLHRERRGRGLHTRGRRPGAGAQGCEESEARSAAREEAEAPREETRSEEGEARLEGEAPCEEGRPEEGEARREAQTARGKDGQAAGHQEEDCDEGKAGPLTAPLSYSGARPARGAHRVSYFAWHVIVTCDVLHCAPFAVTVNVESAELPAQ